MIYFDNDNIAIRCEIKPLIKCNNQQNGSQINKYFQKTINKSRAVLIIIRLFLSINEPTIFMSTIEHVKGYQVNCKKRDLMKME